MRKILTFLIAISSPLILFGQSPGGVTPAAWYRADATSTLFSDAGVTNSANNSTVYQWNDVQGNGFNLLQATAGLRPTFSNTTTLANFNPTVTFQSKWMEFQPGTGVNIIDRVNGTLFTAGYINTLTQFGLFGFDSTMDYPGLHSSNNGLNNVLFYTGGPGYQGVTTNSFQNNFYFTAGASWQNGAGANASYAGATVSLNGSRTDYSGTQLQNAVLDVNARDIRVGGDTNYGSMNGQVNEMLIFENRLSTDEMDRVESYLAIKYGTTYAQGTRDYKNSSSGVVWSSSGNTGYNNNIAGIARDATGLNQKQSWSTNSGKQVLISTTGLANTNAANTTSLTAGQYLIWGDNGLAKTPNVSISGISGINYRFASIWKVQNTGNVGTVRVTWPSGLSNLKLIQSSDAVFDNTDTATDMSVNTQTVNGVTYNYADVSLANGQYFTFAAYVHAPGGVISSLWYRADKGLIPATGAVTTWTDYSAGQIPVTSALSSSTSAPTSVDGTALNFNFNPAVTFVPANALGNSSILNAVSSTNYSIYTSTTSVTGSGYDRVVGLNYSALTGGNKYDSPGIAAVNINMRDNAAGSHINAAVTPVAAQYTQLSNTSIVRNSFTNNQFQRAQNGAAVNSTMAMTALTTWPDGGIVLGRNANDGGDDNGVGMTMSETIVFDGTLSANDINRVDSYLAIKGGITLDITNTPNYLSSTSANVWNSSTNTGYNNNIFGIANDFISDLNQKQSKSINNSQKLIIGAAGGALANTNALNTNTLADGQFLMVGDNGLQQIPSVAISGIPGANYRFASIWKAQNTGSVGTVRVAWPAGFTNLRLVQSSDPTFASGNTVTDMSVNTQTVNGVTYNYADVTLANGQYFTFAAFVQAPGGVVGPDFWVKSDDAGAIATGWKDNSLNTDDIPNVGGVTLSAADRNHNFYPYTTGYSGSKFFYNSNSLMNPLGNVELPNTNTSIFSAVRPTTANGTGRITGIDDDTNAAEPGISIATGKPRQYEFFNTITSTDFSIAFNNGVSNIFSAIANNSIANGGTSSSSGGEKILGLNGSYETTSFTGSNKFQIYGRNLRIGQSGWDAGGPFPGDVMEIAWYKRTLTPNEQSRVNSYLAVKNGVTLNENYLDTGSNVVWSRTLNTGYNNNIFGIAKDDATALHQKQAGSVNNGQKLVISTTGLADSNAANSTGIATDLQYLMIGDNGLKQGLSVPISGITGINYRFASIWKTQNTGIGTVRVAWPAGLSNLKLIQSSDAVIDNTDTLTDMSVNTQTINGVTYNYADVTLANGQFFTFAAFAHAPGGVINGLSQWYRADIDATNTGNGTDVTIWKDYFAGTVAAQIAGKALPKYKIGASTYFNYNPGINFTAITQTLGNNTTQTITNTSNDIFTVTKEGMTAPGSPTPHFFSITADNATTDLSAWDYTGFWPVSATIERRVAGGGTQFVGSGVNFSTTIPSIMYNTFTNTTAARGLNGAANGSTASYSAVGLALGGHVFGDTRWTGNSSDNGGIIGDIGETIIYGDGNLSAAERRKVDTYLAIKYGITLGRVATDNYVSSADAAIWNGALNTTYNNNVFGLAKDDISSLHQKVSKSVNAGTILTVATNNDFVSQNTTASRTALSGDQKYFLAGDNAVTATPLVGLTVAGNPAQRIQRIWLSQRTNTLGNIYFSADLSAYGTGFAAGNNIRMFVADDAAFTVNVQSVAGTYSGGQWVFSKSFDSDATARYITFGSELQPQVLWVKADKGVNSASGVPADNTQITTWYDQETVNGSQDGTAPTVDPGESAETAATLPTLPLYKYNATDNFNFNPVVNFSNAGRGNAVQFTTPTFGTQTVISVFKAAGFGTQYYENMLLYGGDVSTPSSGDPAPARADMSLGVSAGSFMSFGGGSNGDYSYLGNLGLQTQPAIGTMLRNRVGDEEVYYSTYGNGSNDILNQNADPTNTLTGEGRLLSGLVRIGKHFSAPTTLNLPDGRLNGSYAELIVYDRVLSNAERAMVESYLAVKYGITLTGGTDQVGASVGNVGYDYVNSSGTVVRASDTTYKYDVFGLGRDDHYGLNQRISKSNNAGDILTVSTNTDFTSLNLAATRTAIDGDQEYMLFANNKGSGSAVVEQTTELPANVQRRLDREWKVAQANTDGTDISNISLKFNLTGVTLTGATATNVMLLVDSDGDGDFTTGTVQVIPASSYTAGSAASFNNVTLTNGQVFTLGLAQGLCYKPAAVAGVGNPALNSKVGITSLNRAGTTGDNWPGIRTGGWLVLESKTKGFVPNRVAFSGANPVGIAPANFVEGMMVYDTTNKCMKMYTSQDNGATFGWYCISTQTCPDGAGGYNTDSTKTCEHRILGSFRI